MKFFVCRILMLAAVAQLPANNPEAAEAIPGSEVGAKAGVDHQGEGLSVSAMTDGARLHCVFQRLDGAATGDGLWLTSTATSPANDRFQVKAAKVGRIKPSVPSNSDRANVGPRTASSAASLPASGSVLVTGQTVRFARPGLVEEYTASMDGVRQDFVVTRKPAGAGELEVRLAVSGAQVAAVPGGVNLLLANSVRKIAYRRLRVTDALGRELPARMEVVSVGDEATSFQSNADGGVWKAGMSRQPRASSPAGEITVVVNDADAVYPVRIDPTFSDANWVRLGGFPGANGTIYSAAIDGAGNLYIGGYFTIVGDTNANGIAKWDGSSWSALGLGVDTTVYALAVSGSNVYAGGDFTTAGGVAASGIAKWNGSNWSALGLGMDTTVYALAVSGSNVYAGGDFTTAGGVTVNHIARWNGSSWNALEGAPNIVGMNSAVYALAVAGSNIYAGGDFIAAGGGAANRIAKWNGSSWSALGIGMNNAVHALAVSGSEVYVGGDFTMAGGTAANSIAKWDGGIWSALGSGMNNSVETLVVSGSDLYAGGDFTLAGGKDSSYIAQASLATNYNQITSTLLSGGNLRFSFVGATGNHYALDRTFNLSPPVNWQPQVTNPAGVGGGWVFTNSAVPTTNNFWLIRSVP